MRIKFEGAETLNEGLKLLESDYGFVVCDENTDITVIATESDESRSTCL